MPHYSPRASAGKKVYIDRSRFGKGTGTPASIGSGGDPVQIVDRPEFADEVVVIHIDGRPVDRQTAIALAKAAVREQKRQESGKKEKNALDEILAEYSAPKPQRKKAKRSGGFSWKTWAILGCVTWVVVAIAAGAPLAILLTPVMGPAIGWVAGGFLAVVFSDRW